MPGVAFDTLFHPGTDSSGEFEMEDILDHCVTRTGTKFLFKWLDHPVIEATWEPEHHLADCHDIFFVYTKLRRLRLSPRGE